MSYCLETVGGAPGLVVGPLGTVGGAPGLVVGPLGTVGGAPGLWWDPWGWRGPLDSSLTLLYLQDRLKIP
jgi:hypothetical protein